MGLQVGDKESARPSQKHKPAGSMLWWGCLGHDLHIPAKLCCNYLRRIVSDVGICPFGTGGWTSEHFARLFSRCHSGEGLFELEESEKHIVQFLNMPLF